MIEATERRLGKSVKRLLAYTGYASTTTLQRSARGWQIPLLPM